MFRMNKKEKSEVVANCDHLSKLKFSKTLPYAFTEHGAIMAASVAMLSNVGKPRGVKKTGNFELPIWHLKLEVTDCDLKLWKL